MRSTKIVTVGESMTFGVIETLARTESLYVADDLMALHHVRHLPVVEEGRVVGVVSHRDLLRAALAETVKQVGRRADEVLRSVRVDAAMSSPAVTVTAATPMDHAIRLMLDKRIGCLPVVGAAGALIGLVTTTDVMRYAVRGADDEPLRRVTWNLA
jgi:CBS domain-containing membrane protein